ncbi:MAG: hypothetical protein V1755_00590 [Chloroflexota bacterium]
MKPDKAAIRRTVELLAEPGQLVELRAPGSRGRFTDFGALAEKAINIKASAVYVTLNPALDGESKGIQDCDIIRRRWLPIDVDPVRPTGVSSTDPEHDDALTLARQIRNNLVGSGWPAPIMADSGNGGHLLWRIDLASDDGGLVHCCLAALARQYDTAGQKIDVVVSNPARIWKLYGTVARKGTDTPERPHRLARLLDVPDELEVVSLELLQQLGGTTPKAKTTKTKDSFDAIAAQLALDGRAWLDRWIADNLPSGMVHGPEPYQGGGRVWELIPCPMNAAHALGEAFIIERADGTKQAGCHHASCQTWGWPELRQRFEGRSISIPSSHAHPAESVAALPAITISPDQDETGREGMSAFCRYAIARGGIYAQGHRLVEVLESESEGEFTGGCMIREAKIDRLRPMIGSCASWWRRNADGVLRRLIGAPDWVVRHIACAGKWPGIPRLSSIVAVPVLRPDGTVISRTGYDTDTGIYLAGLPVQDIGSPTREDALRAMTDLLEVVCDFPFEGAEHQAAWIATLLTCFARSTYTGATPMTLIDGNMRGAGKTLLANLIGLIATGEVLPVTTPPKDGDEWRKKMTSALLAGRPITFIDNIQGHFGGPEIEGLITAGAWSDRLLGTNEMVSIEVKTTVIGTGNNAIPSDDMLRRTLHLRLRTEEEDPSSRTGFRHPDIAAWVLENRPRLIRAALTILRAYRIAGAPVELRQTWGSFEGWSTAIRAPVVWAGLPDPILARRGMDRYDTTAAALTILLGLWPTQNDQLREMSSAELASRANAEETTRWEDALLELVGENRGGKISGRSLGYRLRKYRDRVVGGRRLCASLQNGFTAWVARPVVVAPKPDNGSVQEMQEMLLSSPNASLIDTVLF